MITFYNVPVSGNCHKVRLLLSFLQLDYQTINVDLTQSEHQQDDFLSINPFGQVPVLIDNTVILRDSQAILVYLAKTYGAEDWWPEDPVELGHIMEWLSTAANEIQHGPTRLRAHYKWARPIDLEQTEVTALKVLNIINRHLSNKPWLVGSRVSIADIAIYPYLALAYEGHISLTEYPHIVRWLSHFEQLPGVVGMPGITLS
jgi:glutathione S-transferase